MALASDQQEARYETDAWEDEVSRWLTHRPGLTTTVGEVLGGALGLQREKWTQRDQNRVAAVLKRLGYERRQVRDGSKRFWRYEPMMSPAARACLAR